MSVPRTVQEYEVTRKRLAEAEVFVSAQRAALEQPGLTPKQTALAMSPLLAMCDQLQGELDWFEQARRGEIRPIPSLANIGLSLIALRIARGLTQRQLAERLSINEAQVSKDERNEYHGISVERAQRVLNALDGDVTVSVRLQASVNTLPTRQPDR